MSFAVYFLAVNPVKKSRKCKKEEMMIRGFAVIFLLVNLTLVHVNFRFPLALEFIRGRIKEFFNV